MLLCAQPMLTQAYAGTGLGTSENPYKVASCEQLQDIQNDLSAYYIQTGNIDCSDSVDWNTGAGFSPIVDFAGSYDGQGYAINDLFIEHNDTGLTGLFGNTSDAMITNMHMYGGHVINHGTNSTTGSLIGVASNTTISYCSSTSTVEGYNGGGLIGTVVGGALSKSWYNGTVQLSGGRYTGGISGLVMVGTVISNIYSAGSIGARGGLLGVLGTGTAISDSYSSAAVTYDGTSDTGGLFGSADGVADPTSATNLFFDGTISGPSANSVGEVVGSLENGATLSNLYFQGSGTGLGTTSGGSGTGTGVNSGGSIADYFKNNNSVAPLTAWDFTNTWKTNSGYPELVFANHPSDGDDDNYSDTEEGSGPQIGDANNDSIPDSNQTNVTTFFNPVSNSFTSLQTTCDSNFNVLVGGESSEYKDAAYDYPTGLVKFVARCNTPGATASVTVYFYGNLDLSDVVLRKWNGGSSYTTITSAMLTKVTIGGETAIKAVYQITDGSVLDQDGVADGNIVDPVGLALNVIGVPNTGLGGNAR